MANPILNFQNRLGLRQKAVITFALLGLLVGIASNVIIQSALQPILQDTLPTVKEGEQILKMTQQLQSESASYIATGNQIHRTRFLNTEAYINIKLKGYSEFLGDDPGETEVLESFTATIEEISAANKNAITSHSRTLELLEELDSLEEPISTLFYTMQEITNEEVRRNIQEENFEELEKGALRTKDLLSTFSLAIQALQREVNEYIVLSEEETLEDFEETLEILDKTITELSLTFDEDETKEASILQQVTRIKEQIRPLTIEVINSHTETLSLVRKSNSIAEKVDAENANLQRVVDEEIENSLRLSRNSIFISFVVGLLLAIIGYAVANTLVASILELSYTSKEIARGDLGARAEVKSQDEIGTLALAFNEMAKRVQNMLGGLEEQVAERTAELEQISAKAQKRAAQLETIANVASSVASLQGMDQLLPYITQTVSERFEFYHVGIFLLSEDKEFAVLRAANSEGGQAMLARKHQLRIGQEGVVGCTVDQKKARIALDVGDDAVYFNNPDLPDTRSEMALPLMVASEIIGVLDVQSKETNAFSDEDIEVLTTLANQVAVAIQNTRLFRQSQESLEEFDATFQRYISNEWSRFGELTDLRGYRARQSGLEPIKESLQKDSKVEKTDYMHKVPIKLRDVKIGYLNVNLDKPAEQYTEGELDIIQATVDRFALALENARLIETTSRRAGRERLVSDITTKIRSTNDPQMMIQTALDELKEALGVSKVELLPQSPKVD
jgi:GAF domain-containing protein/HAMP domain-containing protein